MNLSPTELRLQSRVDRREIARGKADEIVEMENPSDSEQQHLALLREEMAELDVEIGQLLKDKESDDEAAKQSKLVRQALLRETGTDEDGPVYRNFAEFARDVILTRESSVCSKIAAQFGDDAGLQSSHARLELLKRTNNTLSSNVGGLIPPQHIAQIFQVIDTSRPLVASATRADLNRGTLTFPKITTRPAVAVQANEKTAAGDTGMVVDMVTATASVYLGGGDLSWQAINWSTPSALDLWFQLAAADYALKTETDAANVVIDDAFVNSVGSQADFTSDSFADIMTAVGEGYGEVFANSQRIANTVLLSPDAFGYLLGLTSDAFAQFMTVSASNMGPLNVIVSRGLDAATAIVGDMAGLLVAETAGAPVELRVVEPAIGGLEVGLIGAFEAVVVDPGAFALISTAS